MLVDENFLKCDGLWEEVRDFKDVLMNLEVKVRAIRP